MSLCLVEIQAHALREKHTLDIRAFVKERKMEKPPLKYVFERSRNGVALELKASLCTHIQAKKPKMPGGFLKSGKFGQSPLSPPHSFKWRPVNQFWLEKENHFCPLQLSEICRHLNITRLICQGRVSQTWRLEGGGTWTLDRE